MNKLCITERWKKFEKNNVTVALNVLHIKNKLNIYPAYILKRN